MKTTSRIFSPGALRLGALLLLLLPCSQLFAHAGHDHTPGDSDEAAGTGPIQITAEAKQNLGVTTAEAEVRTIEKVLKALGQIQPLPGRQAVVSSRIQGRVLSLAVNEGQRVKKGDPVAVIESLQIGDPPPRATYNSPIDGVVTARRVVLGSSVDQNTPLIEVADLSEVYAEAKVFEGQVNLVKPGQKARVQVESYPGETFEGAVELISSQLDPESRTLRAWVRLKNDDYKLRPNMQASLSLITAEGDSVTAVPRSAVLGDTGNLFVFVEIGDKGLSYERRPIVAGITDDRFIEAVEGVLPGDKVVTQGNYQLQYVSTKKPPAAPGKPDAHDEHAPSEPAASANNGLPAWLRSPWLAAGLGISLLLNVILIATRPRRAAAESSSGPSYRSAPTTANGQSAHSISRH